MDGDPETGSLILPMDVGAFRPLGGASQVTLGVSKHFARITDVVGIKQLFDHAI